MVSPQNVPNTATSPPPLTAPTGRELVHPEEAGLYAPQAVWPSHSMVSWRAVLLGSLLTCALTILSASFAFACGVAGLSGGQYGWSSGIWSAVTAAITFFAGGCVAAYMCSPAIGRRFSSLHGVAVWAVTVPLILAVFGTMAWMFSNNAIIVTDLVRMTVQAPVYRNQPTWSGETGAAWGSFISLTIGLIAAFLGGIVGSMREVDLRAVELERRLEQRLP